VAVAVAVAVLWGDASLFEKACASAVAALGKARSAAPVQQRQTAGDGSSSNSTALLSITAGIRTGSSLKSVAARQANLCTTAAVCVGVCAVCCARFKSTTGLQAPAAASFPSSRLTACYHLDEASVVRGLNQCRLNEGGNTRQLTNSRSKAAGRVYVRYGATKGM
jgi:hypothetical protein